MKAILSKLVLTIAFVAASLPAKADIIVALEPESQSVNVGGSVFMDLVVSGLGDLASPSLGGFAFELTFNRTVLSPLPVTFGSQLDLGILGSVQFSDLTIQGVVRLDEVSIESSSDLQASQPASFTLATLGFNGVSSGSSTVNFRTGSLSDETGLISLAFLTKPALVQVTTPTPQVPDSGSTVTLLAVGFAVVLSARRIGRA